MEVVLARQNYNFDVDFVFVLADWARIGELLLSVEEGLGLGWLPAVHFELVSLCLSEATSHTACVFSEFEQLLVVHIVDVRVIRIFYEAFFVIKHISLVTILIIVQLRLLI